MADKPFIEIQGVKVPTFIYGTAWKENDTTRLTRLAVEAGFRGIDTANQRRHYFEAGVGEALAEVFSTGGIGRGDLFLQTKFTSREGQDQRLPYDPGASVETQVEQSLASSLQHLRVQYLDSYVLHGPTFREGLTVQDWEAWRAMEHLHASAKTRLIGVSNVTITQLEALYDGALTKPAIVQNRCYASLGWDRSIRQFCKQKDILYQGFSLLTANREVMSHPLIKKICVQKNKTAPQVIFRFAQQIGMVTLTGTTSAKHMNEDLESDKFELNADEVIAIETLGSESGFFQRNKN